MKVFAALVLSLLSYTLLASAKPEARVETTVPSTDSTLFAIYQAKLDSAITFPDKQDTATMYRLFREAIALLEESSHSAALAKGYLAYGQKEYALGYFLRSESYLRKAKELAESSKLVHEKAMALQYLAHIAWRMGDNPRAVQEILQSMSLFQEVNDTLQYAQSANILGGVYTSLGKYKEASEIYQEMLALAAYQKDTLQMAQNYEYLGIIHFFEQGYDSALFYYQKSYDFNVLMNADIASAINLGNMAEVYEYLGDYEKALSFYIKAAEIEERNNFNSGLIFIYYGIGKVLTQQNRFEEGLAYYQKSLTQIDKTGEFRERPNVYLLMADNYEKQNRSRQALVYHKRSVALKDSIDNLDKNRQLEEMRVLYDLESKERQNQLLKYENELNKAELDSKKNIIQFQLILVLLLVAFLLIVSGLALNVIKKRKKLDQANLTKDKLFRILGHDLRGPVGNVRSMVELIQSDPEISRSEELARHLKTVHHAVDNTFHLLNDLLIWSNIQRDGLQLHPTRVALCPIIERCLSNIQYDCQKKEIVVLNFVKDDLYVWADENALMTVIRNLLSNAIKFTPRLGTVTINAQLSLVAGMIEVSISDTGAGIPADKLAQLFDHYYHETTFGTENEKGSGLGLSICKEFIERSGGQLGAISDIGKGSRFYFTLPSECPSERNLQAERKPETEG
ncbi:tetratricopeptide repeat protein [Cytophagales bacterium LB-30]|uniref:histidine kinase n=1 Tax=Shiella aurantiaca TaxID=3058365 RepID=A0ABT8F6E7_9BACT|nr:tetratricopeptide repeat protein [Shiella aurantiaca]MDN4166048.1 tetratricopeptide repeat protein [Shiella aurantiaca]